MTIPIGNTKTFQMSGTAKRWTAREHLAAEFAKALIVCPDFVSGHAQPTDRNGVAVVEPRAVVRNAFRLADAMLEYRDE